MGRSRVSVALAKWARREGAGRLAARRVGCWGTGVRLFAAAAVSLIALFAATASSQAAGKAGAPAPAEPSPPQVTLTVLVIQASPAKGEIDPQLRGIAEKLRGTVAFGSLKLLRRAFATNRYGQEFTVSLPEGMELVATPLEERGGVVRTRCVLLRTDPGKPQKKTILNCTISAPKGEGYTIAGPALAEGRLVLVVSAE